MEQPTLPWKARAEKAEIDAMEWKAKSTRTRDSFVSLQDSYDEEVRQRFAAEERAKEAEAACAEIRSSIVHILESGPADALAYRVSLTEIAAGKDKDGTIRPGTSLLARLKAAEARVRAIEYAYQVDSGALPMRLLDAESHIAIVTGALEKERRIRKEAEEMATRVLEEVVEPLRPFAEEHADLVALPVVRVLPRLLARLKAAEAVVDAARVCGNDEGFLELGRSLLAYDVARKEAT